MSEDKTTLGYSELFRLIHQRLAEKFSLWDDMLAVIDLCEQRVPHPDWDKFRQIPYDEQDELQEWLETVFTEEPPDFVLAGLWFGIFQATSEGKTFADMYVSGTSEYSDDEPDMDWASDPDYIPECCDADSQTLNDIYRIAYRSKDGLRNEAEYALCLAYGAFVVKRILSGINPELIVTDNPQVGVAVGFDSGDYIRVGYITPNGLHIRPPVDLPEDDPNE
jgi:hypothetical protein